MLITPAQALDQAYAAQDHAHADSGWGFAYARGRYYVFAGPPGVGKTSWVLTQCAPDGALASFGPMLLWTLEMPPADLLARWCTIHGVPMSSAGVKEFPGRFWVGDSPPPPTEVARGAVIVDYIQKLGGNGVATEQARIASDFLRNTALRMNVPLIAISSVSRENAVRLRNAGPDDDPASYMHVSAHSSGIEYDAAGLLASSGDYVFLAKNRYGGTATYEVDFDGATGCLSGRLLSEYDPPAAVAPPSSEERILAHILARKSFLPATRTAIAEAAPMRKQDALRAIAALLARGDLDVDARKRIVLPEGQQ